MKRLFFTFIVLSSLIFNNNVRGQEIIYPDEETIQSFENITSNHLKNNKTLHAALPGTIDNNVEDLTQIDWAYKAIIELNQKYNLLSGFPDGEFKANKTLTRYELAQLLSKTINKIEHDQIEITAIEKAALNNLKKEFDKEIMTLAARIELNSQNIATLKETHNADINSINQELDDLKKRSYFNPELRFRLGLGDPEAFAETRLRLTTKTYLSKKTWARVRLEGRTANLINHSERNADITDADLTLAFIETGDLTKWLPEKYGELNLIGGLLHTNRLFTRQYTVAVDQRGFSDVIMAVSPFNSQYLSMSYELACGRRMAAGGEYIKKFNKYNGIIKAGALRSTGGSIDIPGIDIESSGDESTFYCVMGQMDLPVKNQPVELKVSHYYSFDDDQLAQNTWTVGGRVATKFKNVGVFKAALIRYGGQTSPRLIKGIGGDGFSYQFAYNPTIKAFGNLFGNPEKVDQNNYNYVPGKTEIGIAFANLHNDNEGHLKVLDLFASRYLTENIYGMVRYTHASPNTKFLGLSIQNSVELLTVFKF